MITFPLGKQGIERLASSQQGLFDEVLTKRHGNYVGESRCLEACPKPGCANSLSLLPGHWLNELVGRKKKVRWDRGV